MTPEAVTEFLRNFGLIIGAVILVSLTIVTLLFIVAIRQVRHIDVPPGAGFGETLLHTPFVVVIMIDLLDATLDIFAAPIAWVMLDYLGLKALRAVSTLEALIPLTQWLPTMTAAWIWVRIFGVRGEGMLATVNEEEK